MLQMRERVWERQLGSTNLKGLSIANFWHDKKPCMTSADVEEVWKVRGWDETDHLGVWGKATAGSSEKPGLFPRSTEESRLAGVSSSQGTGKSWLS